MRGSAGDLRYFAHHDVDTRVHQVPDILNETGALGFIERAFRNHAYFPSPLPCLGHLGVLDSA